MTYASTKVAAAHDGSTKRELNKKNQREESQISELWKQGAWRDFSAFAISSNCLLRHKPLILNLAQQDYLQESQDAQESPAVGEYCERYAGLGELLENSIFTRLTVAKALHSNPELWQSNNKFAWPLPGEVFADFRVQEELGRGALGRVFLCQQLRLGERSVAVKVEFGDCAIEPTLLGKLHHENIIPILSANYDQATEVSYLCMPFLGRSTLVDLIQLAFLNGPPRNSQAILQAGQLCLKATDQECLQPTRVDQTISKRTSYVTGVIWIAGQLAQALSHAHSQEVVHGDIKPSNVLLTPTGIPMLFDFNLGIHCQAATSPPGGTLPYMAPEQLQLACSDDSLLATGSGIAADVYSFGALLYEMLSGKPPFGVPDVSNDSKAEVARSLLHNQRHGCPNLTTLIQGVDPQLASMVQRCLAFDPQLRPASMHEVSEQLEKYASRTAIVRRQYYRQPIRSRLAVVAGFIGLVVAGSYYINQPSLLEQATIAQRQGNNGRSVRLLNRAIEQDGTLLAARLMRAHCQLSLGEYTAAREDLKLLVRDKGNVEAMVCYGYYLNLVENHEAAAQWYQRAMGNGLRTAALLNNLAVSYRLDSDEVSRAVRLRRASSLLEEAVVLKPDSAAIHLNALIIAQYRLEIQDLQVLPVAQAHAQWLQEHAHEYAQVYASLVVTHHTLKELELPDQLDPLPPNLKSSNASASLRLPSFLDPLAG